MVNQIIKYKPQIFSLILVILSFFIGYKNNDISKYFNSLFKEKKVKNKDLASKIEKKEKDKKKKLLPSPKPFLKPGTKHIDTFLPKRNKILKKEPKNIYHETFKSTMESIRPGEVQKRQRKVHNLYFDTLRKQLKESKSRNNLKDKPKKENKNPISQDLEGEEQIIDSEENENIELEEELQRLENEELENTIVDILDENM